MSDAKKLAAAVEGTALNPIAIEFTIEIPAKVVITDRWLQEALGMTARDFLEHPEKVRRLSERITDVVTTKARDWPIRDSRVGMIITGAAAVMENKTAIDVDIEECGLGESKI